MKYLVLCATLNLLFFADTVWSSGKCLAGFWPVVRGCGVPLGQFGPQAPEDFPPEIDTKSWQIKIVSAVPVLKCSVRLKTKRSGLFVSGEQMTAGYKWTQLSFREPCGAANLDQLKRWRTLFTDTNIHSKYRPEAVKSSAIRIPRLGNQFRV